jgi:histidine triad (HIT) family protein
LPHDLLRKSAPLPLEARTRSFANCIANGIETMSNYDPNNVFAKILRGELPAYKVYEDDKTFAFLDIMPRAPGHTLVVPKAPARTIVDIEPDDLVHLVKTTQKVARAAMTVFGADGLTIHQFNEPAGGQVVFHLHIHVIPRKNGEVLKSPAAVKEQPGVLAEHARKLAAALQNAQA